MWMVHLHSAAAPARVSRSKCGCHSESDSRSTAHTQANEFNDARSRVDAMEMRSSVGRVVRLPEMLSGERSGFDRGSWVQASTFDQSCFTCS